MESTIKIIGPSKANTNKSLVGSGFVILKAIPGVTDRAHPILITAAHVLDDVSGDAARFIFRTYDTNGGYSRVERELPIRVFGQPIYVRHKLADVAAMHIPVPIGFPRYRVLSTAIMEDKSLEEFELTAGGQILTLGYPFGIEANQLGFPILRSGRISSYPFRRVGTNNTFLIDLEIYGGNSGGPIFLDERSPTYDGKTHVATTIHGIVGLVSKRQTIRDRFEGTFETREQEHSLNLAIAVHSGAILETIEMLPSTYKESLIGAAQAAVAAADKEAKAAAEAARRAAEGSGAGTDKQP